MKTIILCSLLALAGCATEAQRQAKLESMIVAAEQQCKTLGVQQGTQQFTNCVFSAVQMEQQREQAERLYWANAIRNTGNTLYGPEATRAQQIPTQPYIYTPPKVTNCQPDGNGGMRCIQQ